MAAGASDSVIESYCASGARRKQMRGVLAGVAGGAGGGEGGWYGGGVAKMKAMGLENVHTEKYQLWRGWTRGTAQGELLEPIRRPLHVDAMGWTGSTPAGGAEGEVVAVNLFNIEEEVKQTSRLSGKVVLVLMQGVPRKNADSLFAIYGDF